MEETFLMRQDVTKSGFQLVEESADDIVIYQNGEPIIRIDLPDKEMEVIIEQKKEYVLLDIYNELGYEIEPHEMKKAEKFINTNQADFLLEVY